MPTGSFTAGRGYEFDDTILGTAGEVQEYTDLVPAGEAKFSPGAVFANSSSDEDEELAGTATIRGWLVGENRTFVKDYTIYTKTIIGLAFAGIYSTGTTARGIKVLNSI